MLKVLLCPTLVYMPCHISPGTGALTHAYTQSLCSRASALVPEGPPALNASFSLSNSVISRS